MRKDTHIVKHHGKQVRVKRNKEGVLGRTCSNCKKFLPYTDYVPRYVDGHHYLYSQCNPCKVSQTKSWRRTNKEATILASAKCRAKRQGYSFDLTLEDIVIPDICPILGISLEKETLAKRVDGTVSIDRIDNTKGYTKENIVICSWRANKIKTDASFEEIEAIYNFMKQNTKEK